MKAKFILVAAVVALSACKKDEPASPAIPLPIVRHLYFTGATADEVGVFVARATQSNHEYNWTPYYGDTLTLTLNVGGLQSSIYRHDTIKFVPHVTENKNITVWLEGLAAFDVTLDPASNDQVAHTLVTDW